MTYTSLIWLLFGIGLLLYIIRTAIESMSKSAVAFLGLFNLNYLD